MNASFAQSNLGLPFIKYYGAKEYRAGIQNRTIVQNHSGLMYFANNFGLLEYDGLNWRTYPLPRETKVRDIAIDQNGVIHVASQGDFGYYLADKTNSLTYRSLVKQLPGDQRNFEETWKVFVRGAETIFCTFKNLYIFKNLELTQIIELAEEANDFFMVDKQLYINSLESGLSWLKQGKIVPTPGSKNYQNMAITGILPLANNHLMIATSQNGLYVYNGEVHSEWNISITDELKSNQINVLYRLRNGDIAIGTQNSGLYIITPSGKLLYHIGKDEGLENRTILSMTQDNPGNLWLSHSNGISLIELNVPFSLIDEQSGLPGTGYDGILYDNKIYLGTNNGLYYKQLDNSSSFKLISGTEGQVYNIQIIDDQLLMGHHQGTYVIKNDQAVQLHDELGVWTFLKPTGHNDKLIAGTYKGLQLYTKKSNGQWSFKHNIRGLSESSRVMQQTDDGTIWMSHGYKGVYKLRLTENLDSVSYEFYNDKDGFQSNILINVWKINNQVIFSSEDAVYRYNEQTDMFEADPFFELHFGTDAAISYITEDLNGDIYFISNTEIGILEKNVDNSYDKKTTSFNRLEGYLNDDLQKLKILNNKKVLYAAKNGFVIYHKDLSYNYRNDYETLIRRVTVENTDSVIYAGTSNIDGVNINDIVSSITLPYSSNSLLIEYSAPFFSSDQRMKFQYKLNGSDDNWSEWTDKTDKEYTNLREGAYTFSVRAKNTYDEISDRATFEFKISPPWFRSLWAYMVYITLGGIAIALLYSYLDKRHKIEKRKITLSKEKEISQKDSALQSSKEELQKLKNEKLKSEIDSKNKELASSTMHLLNKNSFINSVKHNISTVIKRSKNQEVKKELSRIMQNIDKNIADDDGWNQFSQHFDQVHGDFTRRIKEDYPSLTPQEMKLSAYLRMNLSTKEIAHLLNISVRGVEIARYRLRKKLELQRETNLQEFILSY